MLTSKTTLLGVIAGLTFSVLIEEADAGRGGSGKRGGSSRRSFGSRSIGRQSSGIRSFRSRSSSSNKLFRSNSSNHSNSFRKVTPKSNGKSSFSNRFKNSQNGSSFRSRLNSNSNKSNTSSKRKSFWGGHHGNHHNHHRHWGWGFRHRGWGFGFGRPWYGSRYYFRPTYVGYYNPYCSQVTVAPELGYDNSKPLPEADQAQASTNGQQLFADARVAFRNQDYAAALELANKAAAEMSSDRDIHQFRSLTLFAMKNYNEAAASAHVALNAGAGWNWDSVRSFYASADTYTPQYRALEKFTEDNPKDVAGRFLLAYHYLMLNHVDSARKELKAVTELEPRDQLSQQLLKMVGGEATEGKKEEAAPAESTEKAEETTSQAPEKTTAKQVGTWKATAEQNVTFQMILTEDGKFTWSITAEGNTEQFSGTYTLENDLLTLVREKDGENLIGNVTWKNEDGFNFKLKNGDANDPGLNFAR